MEIYRYDMTIILMDIYRHAIMNIHMDIVTAPESFLYCSSLTGLWLGKACNPLTRYTWLVYLVI